MIKKIEMTSLLASLIMTFSSFAAICPEPESLDQHIQFVGNSVKVKNVKDIGDMVSIGTSQNHNVSYVSFSQAQILGNNFFCTYKGTGEVGLLTLHTTNSIWRQDDINNAWTGNICTIGINECLAKSNPTFPTNFYK